MAWLLLGSVILLWGINWPVMKLGIEDIPPMTFAVIRMVLGAVCMFGVLALRGNRIRLPSRHDLPIVLTVGLLQMGAFLGLVTVALQFVSAGRSSILAYTTALWVVPGAALFLGERLTGTKLIGFMLGMAGVAVMFNPAAFDWTDRNVLIGNGLLMLAALAWAAQIIQVRGHRWHASPLELAPWQFTVAAVALFPIALFMDAGTVCRLDGTGRRRSVLQWADRNGLLLLGGGHGQPCPPRHNDLAGDSRRSGRRRRRFGGDAGRAGDAHQPCGTGADPGRAGVAGPGGSHQDPARNSRAASGIACQRVNL